MEEKFVTASAGTLLLFAALLFFFSIASVLAAPAPVNNPCNEGYAALELNSFNNAMNASADSEKSFEVTQEPESRAIRLNAVMQPEKDAKFEFQLELPANKKSYRTMDNLVRLLENKQLKMLCVKNTSSPAKKVATVNTPGTYVVDPEQELILWLQDQPNEMVVF